jgi:hypothetical protein
MMGLGAIWWGRTYERLMGAESLKARAKRTKSFLKK